jgi:hypothetical protein
MFCLIRGRIPDERSNPLNRFLIGLYRPLLDFVLRHPKTVLAASAPHSRHWSCHWESLFPKVRSKDPKGSGGPIAARPVLGR